MSLSYKMEYPPQLMSDFCIYVCTLKLKLLPLTSAVPNLKQKNKAKDAPNLIIFITPLYLLGILVTLAALRHSFQLIHLT